MFDSEPDARTTRAAFPITPSLENLKNQAKSLLKQALSGDAAAIARITAVRPSAGTRSPSAELTASYRLADAQFAIAHEHEFASWPKLKAYIESLTGHSRRRMRPFQTDISYYIDRAQGLVSNHESGSELAAEQIRGNHPAFAGTASGDILSRPFTLADAQLVTAREHGFSTWTQFARHIDALAKGTETEPFMLAFHAIEAGDVARLESILTRDPSLARARGTNGNTLLNLAGSCRQLEATRPPAPPRRRS